jgi:hypothetical protein
MLENSLDCMASFVKIYCVTQLKAKNNKQTKKQKTKKNKTNKNKTKQNKTK